MNDSSTSLSRSACPTYVLWSCKSCLQSYYLHILCPSVISLYSLWGKRTLLTKNHSLTSPILDLWPNQVLSIKIFIDKFYDFVIFYVNNISVNCMLKNEVIHNKKLNIKYLCSFVVSIFLVIMMKHIDQTFVKLLLWWNVLSFSL